MTLLFLHVAISIAALLIGIPVVIGVVTGHYPRNGSLIFLLLMIANCLSGLVLPAPGFTPAIGVAIISLAVVALAAFAAYSLKLRGLWAKVFALSIVLLQYFNMLVLVVQSFKHVDPLHAIAPVGNEPVVNVTQLVVLVAFIAVGIFAVRRFKGAATVWR